MEIAPPTRVKGRGGGIMANPGKAMPEEYIAASLSIVDFRIAFNETGLQNDQASGPKKMWPKSGLIRILTAWIDFRRLAGSVALVKLNQALIVRSV